MVRFEVIIDEPQAFEFGNDAALTQSTYTGELLSVNALGGDYRE